MDDSEDESEWGELKLTVDCVNWRESRIFRVVGTDGYQKLGHTEGGSYFQID